MCRCKKQDKGYKSISEINLAGKISNGQSIPSAFFCRAYKSLNNGWSGFKSIWGKKIMLLWFLSICERIDSNCICIFSNNSQDITVQGCIIQKYFSFWAKFLMAKAAAMFTIHRHSSAVRAPGKASVLENFLWANGNFFLFWRSLTQSCCDLWFSMCFLKTHGKIATFKKVVIY